uniref:Putative tumor necrosis factor receptor-associated factor 2 n=1 Tax=Ixodes ricinus TaxID=34613 RepID=A0A131Y7N3_IXORI
MPREVQYRDFPGGPIGIEFSDELPHWNLCGVCGMLSAFMWRDELGHVFCKVCIDAHRQNKRIFCNHENRFVELAFLSAAVEIIQLTHDLTVFCPYKKLGCTEYRPLRFMKKHLVKCPLATVMRCKACDAMLPIKDYLDHEALCPEAHVFCSMCVQGMPRRKYKDHQNQCQRCPEPSLREENCRADQSGRAIDDNTAAAQQKLMQEARVNILSLQERIAEMEQRKREDDQSRLCLEICIADQEKLLQEYMEKNKKLEQKIREMEDRQREDDQSRLCLEICIADQDKLLQEYMEKNKKLEQKIREVEDRQREDDQSRLNMKDHIAEQEKLLQDVLEENLRLQEASGLEDPVDLANEVAERSREPAIQTMGHDLSNRIKTCFNYVTKSVRGLPEEGF